MDLYSPPFVLMLHMSTTRTPTFSLNWEISMEELWLSLVEGGENDYVVDKLV